MPRKSATEKPLCHIHDKVEIDKIDAIHQKVCVKESEYPLTKHTDEKHYCLFHLPTKEKDKDKFKQNLDARLKTIEESLAEIKKLPEDKQAKAKKSICYDFRFVWFPLEIDFVDYNFVAVADFSSATFTSRANFTTSVFLSSADFSSATFLAMTSFNSSIFTSSVEFNSSTFSSSSGAYFVSTTFLTRAEFNRTTFSSNADFRSAFFRDSVNFDLAIFGNQVNFSSAIFLGVAGFRSATFSSRVDFSAVIFRSNSHFDFTKFEELSQIVFSNMKFGTLVSFFQTVFQGFVEFEVDVFLDIENFEPARNELEKRLVDKKSELTRRGLEFKVPAVIINPPVINKETILDLQKARITNPERISFSSVRLRPSWFVNVNSRFFIFNDVTWRNIEIDIDKKGLDEEIQSLEQRKIARPIESLIKACHQLADNAEANRRFEEARKFRKQGFALEDQKCHIHEAVPLSYKDLIRRKVCKDFPVVNENGGKYYCILHTPDTNKAEVFQEIFLRLLEENCVDFTAVYFPISIRFSKLPPEMDFSFATFQRQVVFHEAEIQNLIFDDAYFGEDSELIFEYSTCNGRISFKKATFDGKFYLNGFIGNIFFKSSESRLDLKDARFNKPQMINFRSVRLRPHYFVGVDSSKFIFHGCIWKDEMGNKLNIQDEIKKCSTKDLAQACNYLAINYEDARSFEEASMFRKMAFETERLERIEKRKNWRKEIGKVFTDETECKNIFAATTERTKQLGYLLKSHPFDFVHFVYHWLSGYGEKWFRAFCWLLFIWLFFALLYYLFGTFGNEGKEIVGFSQSFGYSLLVMTLQRPEPRPYSWITMILYGFQTILAPLQAALLALAIRRKFMR